MIEKKPDNDLTRDEQIELIRKNLSETLGREIDAKKALNLLALVKIMEDLGVKPIEELAKEMRRRLVEHDFATPATAAMISFDRYAHDPLPSNTNLEILKAQAIASAPDPFQAIEDIIYHITSLDDEFPHSPFNKPGHRIRISAGQVEMRKDLKQAAMREQLKMLNNYDTLMDSVDFYRPDPPIQAPEEKPEVIQGNCRKIGLLAQIVEFLRRNL